MGQKIDQAKIETIRQEFLSGSTLRSLSGKHGVSLRSLADYSKNGEWEMQRKSQQLATGVEVLASAADKRVAAVVQRHHEDTKGVFDKLQMIADQASAFLADRKAELEKADFKDLASLLKLWSNRRVNCTT